MKVALKIENTLLFILVVCKIVMFNKLYTTFCFLTNERERLFRLWTGLSLFP